MSEKFFGWLYTREQQSLRRLYDQNLVLDIASAGLPQKDKLLEIYEPIWDLEVKLFGSVRPTFRQEVGDCVAASKKQSTEKQQVFDILVKRKEAEFHSVFAPWLYGVSRNQILGGLNGDGSTGSAVVEAQSKYGTLFEDDEDVPEYSGRIARLWGSRNNVNFENSVYYKYKDIAKNNTIRYVKLTTIEEVDHAILAGCFPIIASSWGFSIQKKYDNYIYKKTTTWYHQMYFAARKIINGELYFFRHNSWGNEHNPNSVENEFKGGAWQSADSLSDELRTSYVECYATIEFNEELGKTDFGIL